MSDTWPQEYKYFPDLALRQGRHHIRPIHWDDRTAIRVWRNEQIDVLRQEFPLSETDQDRYFKDVVRPQFEEAHPAQLLWAFLEDDQLVGYGGLVHFSWSDLRAEVSFLTDTTRVSQSLTSDWTSFLGLLIPVARENLNLHKLTTETYGSRSDLPPILESMGFAQESKAQDNHKVGNEWVESLHHSLTLQ